MIDMQKHVGRVEEHKVVEHHVIEESLLNLERIINEIRHHFNRYLAKWF
jgi:hypothetical protein